MFFFSMLILASCGKKSTCPAFSTYFMHDSTERYNKFSYFEENKGGEEEEIVNVHSRDLKDYDPDDINRGERPNSKHKPKWKKSKEEFHENGLKKDKTKKKEHHNPMNPGKKKLFSIKKEFIPVKYKGEYKDSLAVPLDTNKGKSSDVPPSKPGGNQAPQTQPPENEKAPE